MASLSSIDLHKSHHDPNCLFFSTASGNARPAGDPSSNSTRGHRHSLSSYGLCREQKRAASRPPKCCWPRCHWEFRVGSATLRRARRCFPKGKKKRKREKERNTTTASCFTGTLTFDSIGNTVFVLCDDPPCVFPRSTPTEPALPAAIAAIA